MQYFGQDGHLRVDSRVENVKQVVHFVGRDECQDLGFELGTGSA